MHLLLLFLPFLSLAEEEKASERYCFSSEGQRTSARLRFKGIQVPSDVLTEDSTCLTIQMSEHRRELVQRYLLSQFPDLKIEFSSATARREACRLKVEKIEASASSGQGAEVSSGVSVWGQSKDAQGKTNFQIQTTRDFELRSGQDLITGACRYLTPDRYEITLTLKRTLPERVPTDLPPGSIVILKEAPKDEKLLDLSTQLTLSRGERIEIGKIIRDLKEKDRTVEGTPRAELENKTGAGVETMYLSLE